MMMEPKCHIRKCKFFFGVANTAPVEKDGSFTTDTGNYTCAAFPDGIPDEISLGNNPHLEPFPGDNGIQYEKG